MKPPASTGLSCVLHGAPHRLDQQPSASISQHLTADVALDQQAPPHTGCESEKPGIYPETLKTASAVPPVNCQRMVSLPVLWPDMPQTGAPGSTQKMECLHMLTFLA
jgi:hypothetical protein